MKINSIYIKNVYQFFIWNGTFELSSFGCYIMTHYFFRKEKLCGKTCPLTKAAHRFCKIRVEHLNWDLRRKGEGVSLCPSLCSNQHFYFVHHILIYLSITLTLSFINSQNFPHVCVTESSNSVSQNNNFDE